MSNELKKVAFSQVMSSNGYQKMIMSTLQDENRARNFTSSIITAVVNNPALQECDEKSVVAAALEGEARNLSLGLGQFYIVPYDTKEGKKGQYQIGYKGYLQLALRSGTYKSIVVTEVKKGELVSFNPFTEEFNFSYIDNFAEREAAETVGYYAMLETVEGFSKPLYWTKAKMEAHARKYSKAYVADINKGTSYTFWSNNFDDMAKKTMLRQLLSKWGLMTTEIRQAVENDEKISDGNTFSYPEENIVEVPTTQEPTKTTNPQEELDPFEEAEREAQQVSIDDF